VSGPATRLPDLRGWWPGSAAPKLKQRSSTRGEHDGHAHSTARRADLACLTCGAAAVTLPDPTFRGMVVEDVTQAYVFDGMTGTPRDPAPDSHRAPDARLVQALPKGKRWPSLSHFVSWDNGCLPLPAAVEEVDSSEGQPSRGGPNGVL
jgi:hypothetical protein